MPCCTLVLHAYQPLTHSLGAYSSLTSPLPTLVSQTASHLSKGPLNIGMKYNCTGSQWSPLMRDEWIWRRGPF